VAARRSADQRHVQRHPDRHLNLPAVHRLPGMDKQIISISISFQFNQIWWLKNYLEIGGDLAATELDQLRHGVPGFEMPE
jgi:hypothetical protein